MIAAFRVASQTSCGAIEETLVGIYSVSAASTELSNLADDSGTALNWLLDALNECEEFQQVTLVERLKTFYSKAEGSRIRNQNLRFLLTSRPYRNIRTQSHSLIRQFPTIHLSGDDESDLIKEQMDLVIYSEVSTIASERCFDRETEDFLLTQL